MLSIGTVAAGNRAQREYHERQLAQARDDYYRESEGPPGVWVGTLASTLGLNGEVSVTQFRHLLDGEHPDTALPLGPTMDQRKTLAFDLAFSAPKSVSLLRMAGDETTSKAVDRAHDRAVHAALEYIEREGWKGRELRGGERVITPGTGTVGVLYRHETTRNADPQLHSHAVLANLVDDGTGRVRAIQSQVLYWQAKTAGTVYQAVLRGELGRELGVEFERPVNGLADIKGFGRDLIDQFSTRRAEIVEALGRAGLSPSSKSAAERAALESRRAKDQSLDHHEWRAQVRRHLADLGLGIDQTRGFVRGHGLRGSETPVETIAVSIADRLRSAPLESITARRATEDERAVRQAAVNVPGGYTYDEVATAMRNAFADDRLVQVEHGDRPRWTTTRHLQIEEEVRDTVLGRAGETAAPRIAPADYRPPTRTGEGHRLSDEQQQVLAEVLTSGRSVEIVRARAGAGKTTIAGLARSEFERRGFRVVGVAPTLQALAELDDAGLQMRETLARTAFSGGEFSRVMRTMGHRTVVVLDEAAMATTRDVAPLLRRAGECGAKVIVIGDDGQLQAVGAGGWFRYLAEHRDVPVLQLTGVHRQRDPVERDRLNQLHRGDVVGWVRWAAHHDRIHITTTVDEGYTSTTARYADALRELNGNVDELVVMAPQNAHRAALNERLRRVVVEHGIVDQRREVDFDGLRVAPGDRLVATSTVAAPGSGIRIVENGERFEVRSVTAADVRARAVAGNRRGGMVDLPAEVLERIDGNRVVDHGYARTVHKAQAMTVGRSILFAPEPALLGRNLAYVGLTRTRDCADLVTVAPDHSTGIERLVRGMADRRDHQAAIGYLDRGLLDPERLNRMSNRELDEHRDALIAEARDTFARLTYLNRETRAAWRAAGDGRGDRELRATRQRLETRRGEFKTLLETHDPTGERQRRGLMERAVRDGERRDRRSIERIDDEVGGREAANVPALDAQQHRARREQGEIETYGLSLLRAIDDVHRQQVDRDSGPVELAGVPEHERPALAMRMVRTRTAQLDALAASAARQVGSGHPVVKRWSAPGPQRRLLGGASLDDTAPERARDPQNRGELGVDR